MLNVYVLLAISFSDLVYYILLKSAALSNVVHQFIIFYLCPLPKPGRGIMISQNQHHKQKHTPVAGFLLPIQTLRDFLHHPAYTSHKYHWIFFLLSFEHWKAISGTLVLARKLPRWCWFCAGINMIIALYVFTGFNYQTRLYLQQ